MLIMLRCDGKRVVFGTSLCLDKVNEAVSNALTHNKNNFVYGDWENCLNKVFLNIVDEFKFLEEFDIGHSIKEENVQVFYDIHYSSEHGLMSEVNARFLTHSQKLKVKK